MQQTAGNGLLTVDVCPGEERRVLGEGIGDIIVGAVGIEVCLPWIVVILSGQKSSRQSGQINHTLVSTLNSQFRVLWGTAAMMQQDGASRGSLERETEE